MTTLSADVLQYLKEIEAELPIEETARALKLTALPKIDKKKREEKKITTKPKPSVSKPVIPPGPSAPSTTKPKPIITPPPSVPRPIPKEPVTETCDLASGCVRFSHIRNANPYSSKTIYSKGDLVYVARTDLSYVSLVNNNKSNAPSQSPEQWQIKSSGVVNSLYSLLTPNDRALLRIADCGAGPYSTDCGFLAIAAALEGYWPEEEQGRSMTHKQRRLRQDLWKVISDSDSLLDEFTSAYREIDIKEDTAYASEMITVHRWSSANRAQLYMWIVGILPQRVQNKPEIWEEKTSYSKDTQVSIRVNSIRRKYIALMDVPAGTKPTDSSVYWFPLANNRGFQADITAMIWLSRAPIFQVNNIRVCTLSVPSVLDENDRPISGPVAQFFRLQTPLDAFDPAFDEQVIAANDTIYQYILLWHKGAHWQLLGHRVSASLTSASTSTSTSASASAKAVEESKRITKRLFRVQNFPQSPFLPNHQTISQELIAGIANHQPCSSDSGDRLTFTKLQSKDVILSTLKESFSIHPLWLNGIGRMCITSNGLVEPNEEANLATFHRFQRRLLEQLFIGAYRNPSMNHFVRASLAFLFGSTLYLEEDGKYDSKDIAEVRAMVEERKNWNMSNDEYITWSSSILRQFDNLETNEAIQAIQWKIAFNQPIYRVSRIKELYPVDDNLKRKGADEWSVTKAYQDGDFVFVDTNDPSFSRSIYRYHITGRSEKKGDDSFRKSSSKSWELVAIANPSFGSIRPSRPVDQWTFEQVKGLWENPILKSDGPSIDYVYDAKWTQFLPDYYDYGHDEIYNTLTEIDSQMMQPQSSLWISTSTALSNFEKWKSAQKINPESTFAAGIYYNRKRRQWMREVVRQAFQLDDSPLRLEGPWASEYLPNVIIHDIQTRLANLVTPVVAQKLEESKQAWRQRDFQAIQSADADANVDVDAETKVRNAIQSDPSPFRIFSEMGLAMLSEIIPLVPPGNQRIVLFSREDAKSNFRLTHVHRTVSLTSTDQFAILLQTYNTRSEKVWHMIAAPNTPSNFRWMRPLLVPKWVMHALFTNIELASIISQRLS